MQFIQEQALSYDDISIVPRYSNTGRSANLTAAGGHRYPFIPAPMINVASSNMLKYFVDFGCAAIVHRYFDTVEEQFSFSKNVGCGVSKLTFAIGSYSKHAEWIDFLLHNGVTKFCIDMAHGHSEQCIETTKYLADKLSGVKREDLIIMAGNICTADAAVALKSAGATMIRAGIASGSICRTWLNTGVGLPMATTIMEIRQAFPDEYTRPLIIADGGIRNGGDVAKAIACGADYVMFGKLLASTSLAGGGSYDKNMEFCSDDEIPHWREYFGMASTRARKSTKSQNPNVSIEGAEGLLRYTGSTPTIINNLIDNLRATCGYVGAMNLGELYRRAVLQRITTASHSEKLIHLDRVHN
jgi:IMP dehydrogenase